MEPARPESGDVPDDTDDSAHGPVAVHLGNRHDRQDRYEAEHHRGGSAQGVCPRADPQTGTVVRGQHRQRHHTYDHHTRSGRHRPDPVGDSGDGVCSSDLGRPGEVVGVGAVESASLPVPLRQFEAARAPARPQPRHSGGHREHDEGEDRDHRDVGHPVGVDDLGTDDPAGVVGGGRSPAEEVGQPDQEPGAERVHGPCRRQQQNRTGERGTQWAGGMTSPENECQRPDDQGAGSVDRKKGRDHVPRPRQRPIGRRQRVAEQQPDDNSADVQRADRQQRGVDHWSRAGETEGRSHAGEEDQPSHEHRRLRKDPHLHGRMRRGQPDDRQHGSRVGEAEAVGHVRRTPQSAMVEIHGEGGIVLPGERVPPEIVDRDLGPTGEPGDTQHRGHCHTHPHGHRPVRLTGHEPVSPRPQPPAVGDTRQAGPALVADHVDGSDRDVGGESDAQDDTEHPHGSHRRALGEVTPTRLDVERLATVTQHPAGEVGEREREQEHPQCPQTGRRRQTTPGVRLDRHGFVLGRTPWAKEASALVAGHQPGQGHVEDVLGRRPSHAVDTQLDDLLVSGDPPLLGPARSHGPSQPTCREGPDDVRAVAGARRGRSCRDGSGASSRRTLPSGGACTARAAPTRTASAPLP